jgi:hypothetical protein
MKKHDYTAMSYLAKTLSEYVVILSEGENRDKVDEEIMAMFASLLEFIEEHLYEVEYEQLIESNKFGLLGKEARIVKDSEGKVCRLDYVKSEIYDTVKAN